MQGHTDTIEDLVWQPGSATELASVGDDFKLLLWDTRAGSAPAAALEKAHGENDLHCVDWSSLELHLLVTGTPLLGDCTKACCLHATAGCYENYSLSVLQSLGCDWPSLQRSPQIPAHLSVLVLRGAPLPGLCSSA